MLTVQVVGTVDPVPVESPYWAGRPYFSSFYPEATIRSLESVPPTADPVFVGPGSAALGQITTYTVDVPVLPLKVDLEDAATLRQQIRSLTDATSAYLVTTDSQLPAALRRADDGRELVRIAAPLAVTQLVLLSWWTLYLVVGSATEERSPGARAGEAARADRPADPPVRAGRGVPAAAGRGAARHADRLPRGARVGPADLRAGHRGASSPGRCSLTVLIAVAGGLVTAALSSRQVFRRPVSELLRRVPSAAGGQRRRSGRRCRAGARASPASCSW